MLELQELLHFEEELTPESTQADFRLHSKPKKFNSSIVDFNHQFKRAATVVQLKKIKKKQKKASHKSRKRGYAFSSEEEVAGSSSSYGLEEYAHEEVTQEVEDDEDFFEMQASVRPKPLKKP